MSKVPGLDDNYYGSNKQPRRSIFYLSSAHCGAGEEGKELYYETGTEGTRPVTIGGKLMLRLLRSCSTIFVNTKRA